MHVDILPIQIHFKELPYSSVVKRMEGNEHLIVNKCLTERCMQCAWALIRITHAVTSGVATCIHLGIPRPVPE